MRMRLAFPAAAAAAVLFLGAALTGRQTPPRVPTPPRLVVLLVADQFRADYVETYGKHWTRGLHELVTRGASFTRAAYPFAATKTCTGHATISSGTLPSTHGIIDNEWFDPATRDFTLCTEDPNARSLVYDGGASQERHSARWLRVPTLADELVRQSGGRARVVSLSIKPRSAIMLGGRGGPTRTIVWAERLGNVWATSSALSARLSPDVEAFVRAKPPNVDELQTWERAAPESIYQFADRAPGEPAPGVFPHRFDNRIRTGRTSPWLFDSWETNPLPSDALGRLAAHLVATQRLGQENTTDLLAVSFSSLDPIGHKYGPKSHEVQDALYRLDAVIGDLLGVLDARVGRGRYVLAFSSDHGVSEMQEQVYPKPEPAAGAAAGARQEGRTTTQEIAGAVESLLDSRLGRGRYVEAVAAAAIYFRPGVLERIQRDAALTSAVGDALRAARGVAGAYWASEMAAATPTNDPILVALRKSYVAGRSGDLAYVLDRNWVTSTDANHGSPYDYDTRVPVIFYGAGIAPGQYTSDATPVDIVPTLSAIAGVKMPRTDGKVLVDALAR